ncbi:hypothetical protein [Vallitalea okinawensis]|uniref:hypothetical protein n=1 Tax=Vallitalea okinawensis TaxID=2078660 RepID=UPI000CFA882A|nr:hypothetical protein [Vallitalea okinawensis]
MEERFIEQIKENEQRCKNNNHRIDKLEDDNKLLYEMVTTTKLIAQQMEQTTQELKEIKKDVLDLKGKPAKRWDLIVTGFISAVVSALATVMVAGVLN